MDELVADKADGAAGETRQSRDRDRAIFLHHALDHIQTVPDGFCSVRLQAGAEQRSFDDLAILDDLNPIAGLADDRARIATYKGIAPEMFAPFHRFEQE